MIRNNPKDCEHPEQERARIVQNLVVIAHELYFTKNQGKQEFSDQILEGINFINWLYNKAFGKGE